MSPSDEVTQKVIEVAAKQVGVDPLGVTRDTHFVNDLNYDSLDEVEFAMKLEEAFGINVSDEEAQKVQTVGQAVDLVLAIVSTPASSR